MVMHACEYKSFDQCLLAGFNFKDNDQTKSFQDIIK